MSSGRGNAAGVVIVGAGHAGGRTAERLRHGGYLRPIDVVGLESELPYERPPLSKNVLTSAELPANAFLLPSSRWKELGVRFHLGAEVGGIDRSAKSVALSDGSRLAYRKLVLATGLSPRKVALLDGISDHVVHLRSFADASNLRDRIRPGMSMVLVGAGLIGLEVAASAARRGAHITVVEAAERPLSRLLPKHITDWLVAFHGEAGIRILCGRQIVSSSPQGSGTVVILDDGTRLSADLVLVGIGGNPNDALAKQAGLETANGVVVNEFCQTSDPDIFAVGDVASHFNPVFATQWRLESWKNAEDQAGVAASHICGRPTPYHEVPWFWTDQHDVNIQIAGVLPDTSPSLERGVVGARGYLAYFLDEGRLRGAVGIGCGRDIRMAREIMKGGARVDLDELRGMGLHDAGQAPERLAS